MPAEPPQFLAPGTPVDLDNCEREPLHWAGAIQPHGTLVACAADAPHAIVQRSEDAAGPAAAAATLADLVGAEHAQRLAALADRDGPPHLRPVRLSPAGALTAPVEAVAYRAGERVLVVELEPAGTTAADEAPTAVAGALAQARSVDDLLERAVHELQRITGYDRVWAYRFEPDAHGVVVAELRAAEGLESFLGLHYPASDIPAQARALFLRNAVRVIVDVGAEPVGITPRENPLTGEWLDLSDSGLRAVSPMHLAYLRAMGVQASMSVALVVDGALWGLVSAHHYAGPVRPSPTQRAAAALLGQVASLQLGLLRDLADAHERLALDAHADAVLAEVADGTSVLDGLQRRPEALLGIAAADGAVLALGDAVRTLGAAPPAAAFGALADLLEREADGAGCVVLDDVPAREAGLGPEATGVLAVALSRARREWLVWTRGPWEQEVVWAHRDKELVRRELDGDLALGPRESYERWSAAAAGRARPWSASERQAALAFRNALGTFVISRAEQLAELNALLAHSNAELETFAFAAAHDLQEPMRGIHSFAAFLLEDHGEALGADGRELATTIQRLSRRSTDLLLALLDYARVSRGPLEPATVSLGAALGDVTRLLERQIAAAGGRVELVSDVTLRIDPAHLEQLLLNLVGNGLKYGGAAPHVRVAGTREPDGSTLVAVEDDGIGIAPEHHQHVFEVFRRLHARDAYGGGSGAGLAIVHRTMERYGGAVELTSSPGHGARFACRFPPQDA